MSLAKSVAGFLVSSLFIITLGLSIFSFTTGSLLQKENIKNLFENQKGEIVNQACENSCSGNFDIQKCQEYCTYLGTQEHIQECRNTCTNNSYQNSVRQDCINLCLNETTNQAYKIVDDVYSKKIIDDMNLGNILPIFKNTLLFIVLCLIFGFSIFFVSDKPISKIGNDIVVVSISMLAIAVIPIFIISPDVPILKTFIDYVLESFNKQLIMGIVLLVLGIVLIVIGKKKNK